MKTNLIILLIWAGGFATGAGVGMQISALFDANIQCQESIVE